MSDRPKAITDNSAWKAGDASWMAERKAQWRAHAVHIEPMNYGATETTLLREYFLFGRMPSEVNWCGSRLPWIPLFYRIWFHPDRSDNSWAQQLKISTWQEFRISVSCFHKICSRGDALAGLEERLATALEGPPKVRRVLDSPSMYPESVAWDKRRVAEWQPVADRHIQDLCDALAREDLSPRCASRYAFPYYEQCGDPIAWSRVVAPQFRTRLSTFFQLIDAAIARGKQRSKLTAAQQGRVELARELATLFDNGFGPREFQALWKGRKKGSEPTTATKANKLGKTAKPIKKRRKATEPAAKTRKAAKSLKAAKPRKPPAR